MLLRSCPAEKPRNSLLYGKLTVDPTTPPITGAFHAGRRSVSLKRLSRQYEISKTLFSNT